MRHMNIFYSEELLRFAGKFPDTPDRLRVIVEFLKQSGLKHKLVEPEPATRKDLELVHDPKYLDEIRQYRRINMYFPDEPINWETYDIASLSAGAAIGAAEQCIKGGQFAFALTRPRGNHAGRDFFGGFAYINNIAVAVAKMLAEGKAKKAMIVNFDAHFCNGTNNIFLNDGRVYLLSIHQHADSVYPYLGREKDSTTRTKYYENPLWVTDKEFVDRFREVVPAFIDEVGPDLIAVSAGFNTYYKDMFFGTVSKIKLPRTYHKIGRVLALKANEIGANIFGVLEGGYWTEDLGELVYNFLMGFQEDRRGRLPDVVDEAHVK